MSAFDRLYVLGHKAFGDLTAPASNPEQERRYLIRYCTGDLDCIIASPEEAMFIWRTDGRCEEIICMGEEPPFRLDRDHLQFELDLN
jgi:hypothetical protein